MILLLYIYSILYVIFYQYFNHHETKLPNSYAIAAIVHSLSIFLYVGTQMLYHRYGKRWEKLGTTRNPAEAIPLEVATDVKKEDSKKGYEEQEATMQPTHRRVELVDPIEPDSSFMKRNLPSIKKKLAKSPRAVNTEHKETTQPTEKLLGPKHSQHVD